MQSPPAKTDSLTKSPIRPKPRLLRVGSDFRMVHAAQCEAHGYSNPAILLDDGHLPMATDSVQQESFLWSRRLFSQTPNNLEDRGDFLVAPGQEMETGVGLTFVRHNIVEKPVLFRSHCFIDTGVYMPNGHIDDIEGD